MFAVVGSLGTEVNTAIRPYLNSKKVPHMLVSTGATTWGADWKQYPWTTGWQPDLPVRGQDLRPGDRPQQPEREDRRPLPERRLRQGPTSRASRRASAPRRRTSSAKEPFEVTAPSVASQIAKLKASGATVFVIIATPTKTIQAYATASALKWSPAVVYTNSVSATDTFLTLAKANGGGDLVNKTFTTQYAKDPANPKWDNDAGDEALQAGDGEVLPQGPRHRRAQPLRGRHGPGVRRSCSTRPARTRPAPR